ncbi:MAG: rod shape-determining protein RodA [Rickettsiales bacterium]|nr:MAG: rod shape-determining protein RodA [Rickettsiales bacterium]
MDYNRERFLKKLRNIPLIIPLLIILLCVYGFVLLYSAAGGSFHPWAYKQITVFCIFMPISILIAMMDLRLIYRFSYLFYIVTLLLLIIVELTGKSAKGATRWLDFGLFTVQPSELVKISVVLMLAKYFHESDKYNTSEYAIIIPIIAAAIPIVLVIKEPDLGTGIITIIVAAAIFFAAGVRMLYFIVGGFLTLSAMPIIWFMMHNYQRTRVLTFLDPARDPLGAGYNIIQSKIAIGSGGLFGKGLLSGTQSHLNFLPEHQTDFIFSFLAEELGFVGGMVLLILYSLLIISSLAVSINCRSKFAKLIAVGITTLFFAHVFINIAMVMGLLPAVGVPLPLISYGRTMLASILIGFGFVMNAAVNQRSNV